MTAAEGVNAPGLDLIDASAIGSDYTVENKLGEGTYGVVFKARSRSTGASVAIKKLRLDGLTEGVPATAIREITLLQDLSSHPNIVRLLQVLCRKRRVYLVFELMDLDLRQFVIGYVKKARAMGPNANPAQPALPISLVKDLTRQILHALWSCHENRIIHRDLKPGNILVCNNNNNNNNNSAHQYIVKLADFGLARTFELPVQTYTHEVVTLWYRAPEVLLGDKHYSPAVDVWSVGCIVAEMAMGLPLLRGENVIDQINKTFALIGTPTEESWPGVSALFRTLFSKGVPGTKGPPQIINAKPRRDWASTVFGAVLDADGQDFMKQMLTLDPRQRPTVSDALAHRWLMRDN